MGKLFYKPLGKELKKGYLGIELGSTRIKAVLIDDCFNTIAYGGKSWESAYQNGIWTYELTDAVSGLKIALQELIENLSEDIDLQCVGISGMMHGYLAFDDQWNQQAQFRTWQTTITREASEELTELLQFNIPQRMSIAHLYQVILNKEPHLPNVRHITTLAGYCHYLLTGVNAVCVDEASGMFPIDSNINDFDLSMIEKVKDRFLQHGVSMDVYETLPKVLVAGDNAGFLTEEGSELLDGLLPLGVPFAPATGDAGTGMVATNSVAPRTGNVSAGTSIFADIVLEHSLTKLYPEIDMFTTPAGNPIVEIHGNNCTNDMNVWVSMFDEVLKLFGADVSKNDLFTQLYLKSLEGNADCSDVSVMNYMAGECVTHLDEGRPLVIREPDSNMNLANFVRSHLYGLFATIRAGIDLLKDEDMPIDCLLGHGGVFKTPGVGQRYLAAAVNADVSCMKNAGEGGPWGMAVLCAYSVNKKGESLAEYLSEKVFSNMEIVTVKPDPVDVAGFQSYMDRFNKCVLLEECAVKEGL